ncbi:MAG: hypothetical protein ACYC54_10390 [Sedimentisphaerales bacterium]
MALKTCKECGNPVSTKAKLCPSCGAPVKRGNRFGCLGVIIAVIFVFAILSNIFNRTNTTSSSSTQTENLNKPPQQPKTDFIDLRQPLQSAVKKIPITNEDGNIVTYENAIEQINIRVGPGMNYAIDETGTLDENEKLYVLEEKDNWIRFRTTQEDHGWSAWIKKDITVSLTEIRQAREAKFGACPSQSSFDMSVRCVKDYLKRVAHDPDSLKFERWSNVYYNDDGWTVRCEYRGKNAFGAYVRNVNWFVIQHGQVIEMADGNKYTEN